MYGGEGGGGGINREFGDLSGLFFYFIFSQKKLLVCAIVDR